MDYENSGPDPKLVVELGEEPDYFPVEPHNNPTGILEPVHHVDTDDDLSNVRMCQMVKTRV